MGEKRSIEVFPFEANVNIKISGGFYTRLSQMMLHISAKHEISDLTKTLKELESREPKDTEEYDLLTLLTLIATIEREVKAQGVLEMKEITLPDDPEDK